MNKHIPPFSSLNAVLLGLSLVMTGCNKDSENSQSPQVPDKNSVGCLVTNDFYAVHFSAYLKPSGDLKTADRAALLKSYCDTLPGPGIAFFSADLIDEDIRQTPIGIRLVELEKVVGNAGKSAESKEIRTLSEVPAKIYANGVVTAQGNIDKNGDYALILAVGGDAAKTEDDRLKIPFHVGSSPYSLYGLSGERLIAAISGVAFAALGTIYLIYRLFKNRKSRC
jgi:hypothetical protein